MCLNGKYIFILMTDSTWERFLKEGDALYDYLITQFENMFESTGKIKRFDMSYMSMPVRHLYEGVHEECGEEVHEEIVPWIHEEHQSGRLFNKDNWKPFRDQYKFTTMYYGYRKLFCFHDFLYFQLAIAEIRHDKPEGGTETSIDFNVALYGWKEKGNECVQPYMEQNIVDDNMMMPERHWMWN